MNAPKSTPLLVACVAAVGLGAYAAVSYAGNMHQHTCPKCGATWSHASGGGDAHRCPKCGTEELFKSKVLTWRGWKDVAPPTQAEREALAEHVHGDKREKLPEAIAMGRA